MKVLLIALLLSGCASNQLPAYMSDPKYCGPGSTCRLMQEIEDEGYYGADYRLFFPIDVRIVP